MCWKPISKDELATQIATSQLRMSNSEKEFWNHISITPEKWNLLPWSKAGKGFWVVGLFGRNVLWYNDVEEGFNVSEYSEYGKINDYFCDQKTLVELIRSKIGSGA